MVVKQHICTTFPDCNIEHRVIGVRNTAAFVQCSRHLSWLQATAIQLVVGYFLSTLTADIPITPSDVELYAVAWEMCEPDFVTRGQTQEDFTEVSLPSLQA